jgi:hypothetical protein
VILIAGFLEWNQRFVREYCLVIIEVIGKSSFFVDVKPFYCIWVWTFLLMMYDLHDVYGAKGVSIFICFANRED